VQSICGEMERCGRCLINPQDPPRTHRWSFLCQHKSLSHNFLFFIPPPPHYDHHDFLGRKYIFSVPCSFGWVSSRASPKPATCLSVATARIVHTSFHRHRHRLCFPEALQTNLRPTALFRLLCFSLPTDRSDSAPQVTAGKLHSGHPIHTPLPLQTTNNKQTRDHV